MICDYCIGRNGWECEDGWNRHENCEYFKLDWDEISDNKKEEIKNILDD